MQWQINVLRSNQFAFQSLFSLSQVDILFLRCVHTTAFSNIIFSFHNNFFTKPLFGDFFLKAEEDILTSKS